MQSSDISEMQDVGLCWQAKAAEREKSLIFTLPDIFTLSRYWELDGNRIININ